MEWLTGLGFTSTKWMLSTVYMHIHMSSRGGRWVNVVRWMMGDDKLFSSTEKLLVTVKTLHPSLYLWNTPLVDNIGAFYNHFVFKLYTICPHAMCRIDMCFLYIYIIYIYIHKKKMKSPIGIINDTCWLYSTVGIFCTTIFIHTSITYQRQNYISFLWSSYAEQSCREDTRMLFKHTYVTMETCVSMATYLKRPLWVFLVPFFCVFFLFFLSSKKQNKMEATLWEEGKE